MKRVHAPGGDKTFEASKKRLKSSRGMFTYDSIAVSSAWELTSVSMRYSQGEGVNTSLSRLCTVPTISIINSVSLYSLRIVVPFLSCVVCMVIFRGTVMCFQGRK